MTHKKCTEIQYLSELVNLLDIDTTRLNTTSWVKRDTMMKIRQDKLY